MKKLCLPVALLMLVLAAQAFAQVPLTHYDTAAVNKIIDEGMNRSQVMETLSWLTDVYGPRLTNSPEYKEAADWTSAKLKEWGLQNVHYDEWGPFGRGWTLKKFSASLTSPRAFPVIAYPKAWSTGLNGTVSADVVYLDADSEADLQKYKGKLKGKFVLVSSPRDVEAHFDPQAERLADSVLLQMANAPMPQGGRRGGFRMPNMAAIMQMPPVQRDSALRALINEFMPGAKEEDIQRTMTNIMASRLGPIKLEFVQSEGAVAALDAGRGDGGTIFVQQASVPYPASTPPSERVSVYDAKAPKIIPQISLAAEHYNRMVRMIQKGQKLKMEMELEVEFTKAANGFNVMAEIPGTDLKDEVVMIGAHFDSWQAGTGATDNGTGSAVCMEAVRILQSLGLKPRRTIRIGLWGGEEQGLHGSREYVKEHFAESPTGGRPGAGGGELTIKPAHEKFSVYFNNDNGTGKVRGVYMQGNETARDIFRAWLTPFKDMGANTLTLNNTGGTDHLAFDGVGLPGFQFIQDPVEYDSRTHHSNMDVYERVQEGDVKQASIIMAAFAYNAAMTDAKFPRKPEPEQPQQRQAGGN
ncbi:MAG: M20/M25/M40 family metallo-hydrolase [Ignavibacteriae bacterium]|nr:M20/M25/M40 family metallo-hydrolase [Ignavibacteriota bacterium]